MTLPDKFTRRPTRPPLSVGSGKLVTPCERMHCEYLSSCASIFADWAAVGGPPPRCSRVRQALDAL